MSRRESIMVLKDTARLEFADPTKTYFKQISYLLQTDNITEATPEEVAMIEAASGKLRANKETYVLRFDRKLFTLAELQAMMNDVNTVEARTIEVVQYPTFVTIADADYEDNVRAYLPDSKYIGEDEVTEVRYKWSEWSTNRRVHRPTVGAVAIPLKSDAGVNIALSDCIRLLEQGHTVEEFNRSTYPAGEGEV